MKRWDEYTPAERGRGCLLLFVLIVLYLAVIHVSDDVMDREQWSIPLRLGVSFAVSMLPVLVTPSGARYLTASVFYAFWLGYVMLRFGSLTGLRRGGQDLVGLLLLTPCIFLLWRMRGRQRKEQP